MYDDRLKLVFAVRAVMRWRCVVSSSQIFHCLIAKVLDALLLVTTSILLEDWLHPQCFV